MLVDAGAFVQIISVELESVLGIRAIPLQRNCQILSSVAAELPGHQDPFERSPRVDQMLGLGHCSAAEDDVEYGDGRGAGRKRAKREREQRSHEEEDQCGFTATVAAAAAAIVGGGFVVLGSHFLNERNVRFCASVDYV